MLYYRCTTISWRCLQNTYIIRFMSTNINQRYIILNLGCCRVFAENVSAKTRQHPKFKIMYCWFMFVDIKRMYTCNIKLTKMTYMDKKTYYGKQALLWSYGSSYCDKISLVKLPTFTRLSDQYPIFHYYVVLQETSLPRVLSFTSQRNYRQFG